MSLFSRLLIVKAVQMVPKEYSPYCLFLLRDFCSGYGLYIYFFSDTFINSKKVRLQTKVKSEVLKENSMVFSTLAQFSEEFVCNILTAKKIFLSNCIHAERECCDWQPQNSCNVMT